MKLILITLFFFLILFIIVVILLGLLRTIQVQNNPLQKEFLKGSIPKNLPDGFYKGSVGNLKTTWQGKRFDSSKSSGINVFKNKQNKEERYPFKTYVGKGAQDEKIEVIKIDYSNNKIPWWLKYILDEIVEVSPGKYLGKAHVLIIPYAPFSLGYFRLEK